MGPLRHQTPNATEKTKTAGTGARGLWPLRRGWKPPPAKRNCFCKLLGNPSQGLRQSSRSRSRRCSRLTGDPRADAVRGFIDLSERGSAKISVDQSGGEGVARADRIGDLDFEAGMFTAFVGGD